MKIAVIFTGGTIGSGNSASGIAPQENGADRLLHSVRFVQETEWGLRLLPSSVGNTQSEQEIQYVCQHPFTLLSENSTGLVLRRLADCIEETLEQPDLDGILITHGTDTLAYSAAAMGYLFAESRIPIVFVSSNYILEDARANGWDNFRYGVAFIIQSPSAKGVFVSYRNAGDVPRIHLATAVIAHQVYSDEVYSVRRRAYGCFALAGDSCQFLCGEGGTVWDVETSPSDNMMRPNLCIPKTESAPILQIYPSPGVRYPEISDNIKAVLHHSYHAGTICGSSQEAKVFFAEARRRNIPVFLCGAEPAMRYESMQRYTDYGIHVLPVASPVAMYMKLWLLLEGNEDVTAWMARRIAGEVVIN